jgi:hypothetical protein
MDQLDGIREVMGSNGTIFEIDQQEARFLSLHTFSCGKFAFCAKPLVTNVHTEHHLTVDNYLREVLRSSGIRCMVHS